MEKRKNCDVVIVGGGVSGLVAARCAAKNGRKVCVLEREEIPGRKIYATGNGRCNYSNINAENSQFVIESLQNDFGVDPYFEDGRVYPRSLEASSFAQALSIGAQRAGAEIICGARVVAVQKIVQGFVVKCEDEREFSCEKLVLACGGKAGIQYGCTGDGYKLAESLGHTIKKPIPALDGLTCKEKLDEIHGVRVHAKATLVQRLPGGSEEDLISDTGEVQFTKDGISGICVMNLSGLVRLEEGKSYKLVLDLFPETSEADLSARFMKRKQEFGCGLSWLLPAKLKDYLHTRRPENLHGPAGMAVVSKALSFEITGTRGWKTAQTTSGGVLLSELDENFESKLCPGLYITGELTDFDGLCGGFNINYAVYSGIRAGQKL